LDAAASAAKGQVVGAFVNIAVPFISCGNRRCLTAEQLCEHTELAAFVRRFPASFEFDPNKMVWLFVEPEGAAS
jgi:hypothetical protein